MRVMCDKPMQRRGAFVWIALFATSLLLQVTAPGYADTLILNSGRQIKGKIISEDEQLVVFDVRQFGASIRSRYAKSDIQSINREIKEGPSYYPLPIIGPIGQVDGVDSFVTASAFREGLHIVKQDSPDYVVLVIDSPGGSIEEMIGIIDAIREAKGLKFIAYVKGNALSAAAIIAMSCPDIFMSSDAIIGAATPWKQGPDGTPDIIEEKFQSAVRATFRTAAKLGGHSELLLRGMMETELELMVTTQDGKREVAQASEELEGKVIKHRGRILTLDAEEALFCGLSSGTVHSLDATAAFLGLEKWHKADDQAWHRIL